MMAVESGGPQSFQKGVIAHARARAGGGRPAPRRDVAGERELGDNGGLAHGRDKIGARGGRNRLAENRLQAWGDHLVVLQLNAPALTLDTQVEVDRSAASFCCRPQVWARGSGGRKHGWYHRRSRVAAIIT